MTRHAPTREEIDNHEATLHGVKIKPLTKECRASNVGRLVSNEGAKCLICRGWFCGGEQQGEPDEGRANDDNDPSNDVSTSWPSSNTHLPHRRRRHSESVGVAIFGDTISEVGHESRFMPRVKGYRYGFDA